MFVVEAKYSISFEVFPDTSTILNINTYRLTDTNIMIMQMENNMLRIYIKNHTISGFEIIMHLSSRDLGNISSTFFHEWAPILRSATAAFFFLQSKYLARISFLVSVTSLSWEQRTVVSKYCIQWSMLPQQFICQKRDQIDKLLVFPLPFPRWVRNSFLVPNLHFHIFNFDFHLWGQFCQFIIHWNNGMGLN